MPRPTPVVNRTTENPFDHLTHQQRRTINCLVAGGVVGTITTITYLFQNNLAPEHYVDYQHMFTHNLYMSIWTVGGAVAGAVVGALLPNSPVLATAMACSLAAFLILR